MTDPSKSVELNDMVTVDPVITGFGAILLIVTLGIWSLIISPVDPEPVPAEFEAVTVIVKLCDTAFPVDV